MPTAGAHTMNVVEILDRLIAFPSVVGTPNHDIADWIREYAEQHGATVTVLPGPEGDRVNLFATLGPADVPGYILSGHMDVVPPNDPTNSRDLFRMQRVGTRLYGRGASDMKGYLAAMLACLDSLRGKTLKQPLHLAFSYDEEAGCRGAPHMISRLPELCARPLGAIIGEPSGLQAICAHKGKAAVRLTVRGRTGHSSRPDQGLNAIHALTEVLGTAVQTARSLTTGPLDPVFEPPYSTLQVGTVRGGQSVNIIPDLCTADLEARAIAGVVPLEILEPIRQHLTRLTEQGYEVDWTVLSNYPSMSLSQESDLARLMVDLTGLPPLAAVSYGTEAGLFQAAGIDAIICGPGDIAHTHKPDEFIETAELEACQQMLERLTARLVA